MIKFPKDRWLGNHWTGVEGDPNRADYFLKVLAHLAATFDFPLPAMIDIIDGYAADFEIAGSRVSARMDSWCFSITFERDEVRDKVFENLTALTSNYFG